MFRKKWHAQRNLRFAILAADCLNIAVHAIKAQRHLHNDKSPVAPSESAKWISSVRMNDNERAARIFDTRVGHTRARARAPHTHTHSLSLCLSVALYRSFTDLANSRPVLRAMHVRGDVRDTAISWHCTLHPPLRRASNSSRRVVAHCVRVARAPYTQSRDSRRAHDLGIDLGREISFRFLPHPLFESTRSNNAHERDALSPRATIMAAKIGARGNKANDTKGLGRATS